MVMGLVYGAGKGGNGDRGGGTAAAGGGDGLAAQVTVGKGRREIVNMVENGQKGEREKEAVVGAGLGVRRSRR